LSVKVSIVRVILVGPFCNQMQLGKYFIFIAYCKVSKILNQKYHVIHMPLTSRAYH